MGLPLTVGPYTGMVTAEYSADCVATSDDFDGDRSVAVLKLLQQSPIEDPR